jgi:hypothetical protein
LINSFTVIKFNLSSVFIVRVDGFKPPISRLELNMLSLHHTPISVSSTIFM